MAETFNTNEPNQVGSLYTNDAKRDQNLDISALVKKAKHEDTVVPEKKPTPLELMQKAKETQQMGMSITKDQYEAGLQKPVKSFAENEERLAAMQDRVDEFDNTFKKRTSVVLIKNPETPQEYTQMMIEIDSVEFDATGKPYFDLKSDDESENIIPKYVRLRTENDPPFSMESDKLLLDGIDSDKVKALSESGKLTEENAANTETELLSEDQEDSEDTARKNTVQLLIDKTGLGTDFIFSDEEKEKIIESQEIRLKEVEFVDIESIITKKSDVSFQDSIKAYQLSNSKTTVCFPASGFRAQMKGMSYGEMGDVALSMDSVTFDQYYKRLSIVYNKMTNISVGPFESFEAFLKGFAYVDIPLALYGLYISTQPEIQQIQLRCGKPECKKNFNWKFSTRSVLRLENCSQTFLDKMKLVATAPAAEYDKIRKESAVMNSKMVKLPYSNFVIEMGIISAYEFLYNFIPVLDEKTFKENFGDDINGTYVQNILLLTTIRSVRIYNGDGTYSEPATGFKDILDALYNISPEEIQILNSLNDKLKEEYQSSFSFGDVVCPHCGNITHDLDLTMDDLLFQTYQHLQSTQINVENIRGL